MAIKAEAESRRLQWQPELTGAYMSAENHAADKVVVSRMGRTIKLGNLGDFPWVKCGVLPSSGKSSWQIRVDNGGYGQCGNMRIGICDFWGRYFWGLWLDTGRLARCERKLNGERFDVHTAKPDGWPDGDKKKVYGPPDPVPYSDIPNRCDLSGRVNGVVVEVVVDHDLGTLCFRVDGGPLLHALDGFPVGARLHPCVEMAFANEDQVSLVRPYL